MIALQKRPLRTLAIALTTLLALSACDKKKDVPTNGEVSTNTSVQPLAPNCDDASVKNSLVMALSLQTSQDVANLMVNFPDDPMLDLPRQVQQRLANLTLDFQNIRAEGEVCVADMIINLPHTDVGYAQRYYMRNGTSVELLAQNKGLKLDGTRIVTPVRYSVTNGQAALLDRPNALALVAEIMSASAYMMSQGAGQINTTARPPIRVEPLAPDFARPAPAPEVVVIPEPVTPSPTVTDEPFSTLEDNSTTHVTPHSPTSEKPKATVAAPKPKPPTAAPSVAPSLPVGDDEIVVIEGDDTY